MRKSRVISKFGIFFSFTLIIVVAIIDASFSSEKIFLLKGWLIDFSYLADILFILAFMVLVISLLLRMSTYKEQWNGFIVFSKSFLPIAVIIFFLSAFFSYFQIGIFDKIHYLIGFVLVFLYSMGMLYFSLKTFYEKW